MKNNFEPFDDFFEKYEAFEQETVDDIIEKYASSKAERHYTISSLIDSRHKQRDAELEALEEKSQRLLKRLRAIQLQRMLEELYCFKDILALQKRLTHDSHT